MRILYDGMIFQLQKAGGINRYFAELISGLPGDFEPVVVAAWNFGRNVPRHPNLQRPRLRAYERPVMAQVHEYWWKPRLLKSIDLYHPTYYELSWGFSLANIKMPMVLTVHDFVFAKYAKEIEGAAKVVQQQREAIERADFIVCVSKATEDDLLERFPGKRGKTVVIHHGSSFAVQKPMAEGAIFERPTFLFVGGRGGYKNFSFLLRAFAKARQANGKLRLRVAGGPLADGERREIQALGLGKVVEAVVFPAEEELIKMYRGSVALVYPSLHEGFGIPLLEAMACRTVAMASNTTSLPEVAGDAGVLLDPRREGDWVEAMLRMARGGTERKALIERGLERVKEFSWKKAVAGHLGVYRSLVG